MADDEQAIHDSSKWTGGSDSRIAESIFYWTHYYVTGIAAIIGIAFFLGTLFTFGALPLYLLMALGGMR